MAGNVKNVEAKVEGGKLILSIDLSKNFGKSAGGTGKTFIIGSSGGFAPIPGMDESWFSLNVCTKKEPATPAASG